ncbi:MAG: sensor histidine kinase [Planctomycetota bacterium]|jgi:signal transduction histidine kinase
MRTKLINLWIKLLKLLRLSPLSLAEKCRLAFGAAVILILILALVFPYIWMGKLTTNACLDVGRAKAEQLLESHFKLGPSSEASLPPLDSSGALIDSNDSKMVWIRFNKKGEKQITRLPKQQRNIIESLRNNESRKDSMYMKKENKTLCSNYIRIFKATGSCISCHNPQGSAKAFSQNETIGALIIKRPTSEFNKFMNIVFVIVAGLIAGAGAIIAFYMITQRVILRPIRQLRALANNVSEGNLDIRSSIKTGDEYEKLAEAFNHMLDGLQQGQEKLRQANKQLDEKIAELSERNIELFKANKLKGEFLANISHEFRTPLNAILGFAEILREKPTSLKEDKIKKYAENILTGGKSLLNMINDLLDMAKARAGKMKLHMAKVSMPQLCKEVIASFSSLTRKKKIKVKLAIEESIPEFMTDDGKVKQIINNFLSNSVKFTPKNGRIEIKAEMADEKTVRIAVSDTGCGIAEADKEKIFEKFRQVDGSITRQSSGSGLGLAICKDLALMLAGDIGMESEVDKGTTFWLDIPVILIDDEKEKKAGSEK